ncbi:hypothetical protein Q4R15_19375 [Morganella morganii]|uniref:hypothetical protein n=1 Tax=Morganella TaxID=581 RepID=UPI0011130FD8|nr:hypothetical protein [Morganella sp. HMSC11D09]
MRKEKINLLYPTLIKPGLAISHFMPPDPIFFVENYPSSCSFYLTSVMYCESNKKYVTELDVFFDGISVLGSSKQDNNSMETFMFSRIDQKSNMIGSSLYVKNVTIEKPGSYDVSFKLYEDINGELSDVLDEKTCSFISATPMRD